MSIGVTNLSEDGIAEVESSDSLIWEELEQFEQETREYSNLCPASQRVLILNIENKTYNEGAFREIGHRQIERIDFLAGPLFDGAIVKVKASCEDNIDLK